MPTPIEHAPAPIVPLRLVFLDLDGTVVDAEHKVSTATVSELDRIRARGVKVSVATGRAYFGAKSVLRTLGVTEPSLFFSGALIVDPRTDEVLHSEALPREETVQLVEDAERAGVHLELYTRDSYFTGTRDPLSHEVHAEYMGFAPGVTDLRTLARTEEILKAVLIATKGVNADALERLISRVSGLSIGVAYGAAHPDVVFANLTSPKASRAHAFEWFLTRFGFSPDEIAAFGDGESDMVFLGRARYGCAMGNAPANVREAAPFVTRTVAEDGVPFALARLVR